MDVSVKTQKWPFMQEKTISTLILRETPRNRASVGFCCMLIRMAATNKQSTGKSAGKFAPCASPLRVEDGLPLWRTVWQVRRTLSAELSKGLKFHFWAYAQKN